MKELGKVLNESVIQVPTIVVKGMRKLIGVFEDPGLIFRLPWLSLFEV